MRPAASSRSTRVFAFELCAEVVLCRRHEGFSRPQFSHPSDENSVRFAVTSVLKRGIGSGRGKSTRRPSRKARGGDRQGCSARGQGARKQGDRGADRSSTLDASTERELR